MAFRRSDRLTAAGLSSTGIPPRRADRTNSATNPSAEADRTNSVTNPSAEALSRLLGLKASERARLYCVSRIASISLPKSSSP
jgi:hypothetical protein